MQPKKILVTGGSGYIGSHTIVELLTSAELSDYEIVSVDNQCNSSRDAYENIQKITGKTIKDYTIDLCDLDATEMIFRENDIACIIHFAAYKSVSESVMEPLKYYYNNITSLLNLLQLCNKYNISRFIFSSSCSIYGNSTDLPVTETTTMGQAMSPYAYTKQIGETVIKDYVKSRILQNETNFFAILLRYFNPVGAHTSGLLGEDPINKPTCLVPLLTLSVSDNSEHSFVIHGNDYNTRDGTCVRDFVHVSDIAKAHVLSVDKLLDYEQKQISSVEIYNLGSGCGITVLEAVKAFEEASTTELKYTIGPRRPGDVESIYADTNLAKKRLNWSATYGIRDMMLSSLKWQENKR